MMKTRVLFVDDEALVLQGLQRMLRPLRHEWDMEFVESGQLALERLAATPFDVVVSDMRMPGMDGAQLLSEVMHRHPRTVRIILSGHADQDLVLKAVGSTHQYLNKPCDADLLRTTVQRAAALGGTVSNEKVKDLVAQMDSLPTLPVVYREILTELRRPDSTVARVGEIIARDVGLTAQVLKLVNSAFFGLRRSVSGPVEAVTFLGLDTMKALVLAMHTFSQFANSELAGLSFAALQRHSLLVAGFSRSLARHEFSDSKSADEAFIAGLLHDAGKLLLAANFKSHYQRVATVAAEGGMPAHVVEMGVFGCTHAEVGGYLLGLWGLPPNIVDAITWHHRPAESGSAVLNTATILHVADSLAHELEPESVGAASPVRQEQFLEQLGVAGRMDAWRGICRASLSSGGLS
ncbi:MAG: response regulator [Limisphaerales bacterium]